jgi:hypothetical protein
VHPSAEHSYLYFFFAATSPYSFDDSRFLFEEEAFREADDLIVALFCVLLLLTWIRLGN